MLVDLENLWKYLDEAELPGTFFDIKRASLQSDVIRLALLAKYGGVYVDLSSLALQSVADAAWERVCQGACLVGYRAPHFISDFVACWFLAAKAREPIIVEWSRQFNELMERYVDDVNIHKDPYFDSVDLAQYLKQGHLSAPFEPRPLWVDYLVVNVVLKAVLDGDQGLRNRLWSTACLVSEKDPLRSPTLWSQAQEHLVPDGVHFPESERLKMRNLLKQDPDFTTRLINLPMVKFFNSGSAFANVSLEEILESPSILGCLARKSLGSLVGEQRPLPWPAMPRLQDLPLIVPSATMPFDWEPDGNFRKPADLQAESVAVATIATDKFYAVGAVGLLRSLRQNSGIRAGTKLICIVPESIEAETFAMLQAEGWQTLVAENFDRDDFPLLFEDMENPDYQHCYLKLHLWDLHRRLGLELQRVLYLDSDTLVVGDLQNALYAAEMEPPNSGVCMAADYDWRKGLLDGFPDDAGSSPRKTESSSTLLTTTSTRSIASSVSNVDTPSAASSSDVRRLRSRSGYGRALAASAFKPESYCNAGVVLLRPSPKVYSSLLEAVKVFKHRKLAEQDLFHEVFTCHGLTKIMEQYYNAQKWINICAPDLWASYDLKIIHYNNKKPWAIKSGKVCTCFDEENSKCQGLVNLWHEVYSCHGRY